jgi:hypothetical protein
MFHVKNCCKPFQWYSALEGSCKAFQWYSALEGFTLKIIGGILFASLYFPCTPTFSLIG